MEEVYTEELRHVLAVLLEEGKWRMRLLGHEDWKKGDRKEEAARDAWENHFTSVLTAYLE